MSTILTNVDQSQNMYVPRTFDAEVSAETELLAGKLLAGRVTFLLGAGFSRAEPTHLPLAPELGQRLHTAFKDSFASATLTLVNPTDLLAVADAIAAADAASGLEVMQHFVASEMPFDTARPNHAHTVLVSLFAEQLVSEAMTTNYDTCVERAGASLGEPCIAPCRAPGELQAGGNKGRLLKLHGCVTNEPSILITTAQLYAPDEWVLASILDASTKDTLVIVGINSVAPYVEATLKNVWLYAENADSIWVIAPTIDPSWDNLIGSGNEAHKVENTAEEFLDELLHACFVSRFRKLIQVAKELDSSAQAQDAINVRVTTGLIDSLKDLPVEALLLGLRAGIIAKQVPTRFVVGDPGLQVLHALAVLRHATEQPIHTTRMGDRVWISLDDLVVNFAYGAVSADGLVKAIEADLYDAKYKNLLAKDARVLALASGFIGPLPGNALPADIVGEPGSDNLIDGPERLDIRWLSLSQVTNAVVSVACERVLEAVA